MKKYVLFSFLTCVFGMTNAQNAQRCGTHEKYLEEIKKNPSIVQKREAIEAKMQQGLRGNSSAVIQKSANTILTIPVVVHVIHESGTPAQNISDAQIYSQIAVMNKDFRRLNSDTNKTPGPFKSLGADCEIEFCLAQQDPDGNWTTGITRTQTTVSDIGNGSYYYQTSMGGRDIWDPSSYLNIWVCEILQSGDTYGFAYTPGFISSQKDGLVVDYRYFGTIGTAQKPGLKLGRTVTHEVGHWFNLEHIWGDEPLCANDDLVSDTPVQDNSTSGCPSSPQVSCGNGPNGNMYSNYMDYTDDDCMNIFTIGQKARMWDAINNYRSSLSGSSGCSPAISVPENNVLKGIEVYPNPGNGKFTIRLGNFATNNLTIQVFNVIGELIQVNTFNDNSSLLNLDISHLRNGIYILGLNNGRDKITKKIFLNK